MSYLPVVAPLYSFSIMFVLVHSSDYSFNDLTYHSFWHGYEGDLVSSPVRTPRGEAGTFTRHVGWIDVHGLMELLCVKTESKN